MSRAFYESINCQSKNRFFLNEGVFFPLTNPLMGDPSVFLHQPVIDLRQLAVGFSDDEIVEGTGRTYSGFARHEIGISTTRQYVNLSRASQNDRASARRPGS